MSADSSTFALPRDSLPLLLDMGRLTTHRSSQLSAALSAAAATAASSAADTRVRLVELQWDMQTGNFIGASLAIIAAATARSPGESPCLSALVASGSRCLQVAACIPSLSCIHSPYHPRRLPAVSARCCFSCTPAIHLPSHPYRHLLQPSPSSPYIPPPSSQPPSHSQPSMTPTHPCGS